MRYGVLLASLFLAVGMTGCLGLEDTWGNLKEDLEANPKFERTQLLDAEQSFTATDYLDPTQPPEGANDTGASWETTFDVVPGTRDIQIGFRINFTSAPTPPDPLPTGPSQSGQVRIYVAPPGDGDERDELYDASGQGGFDIRGPSPGTWTVGYDQGLGEATISFTVDATVPTGQG